MNKIQENMFQLAIRHIQHFIKSEPADIINAKYYLKTYFRTTCMETMCNYVA